MGPFYASAEFPNWWRCTVLYSTYFLTIGVEASECGLSVGAVPSILLDQYICSSSLYPPVDVEGGGYVHGLIRREAVERFPTVEDLVLV